MHMPKFTAGASLYDGGAHRQADAEAFPAAAVEPASDFYVDRPPARLAWPEYVPRPLFCLGQKCVNVDRPGRPPRVICRLAIGFWNPLTRTCDTF